LLPLPVINSQTQQDMASSLWLSITLNVTIAWVLTIHK